MLSTALTNSPENSEGCTNGEYPLAKKLKLEKSYKITQTEKSRVEGYLRIHAGEAVVVLEKPAFSEEILKDYFKGTNNLTKSFHNDIYGDYRYNPTSELNDVKATIIHPATEKNIQRYMTQKHYMIEETSKIYRDIWVYNILEHKSETSKIVVEDTDPNDGFIMVPDLKWSGELDTLYLLAIVNKRNIKSLRDLPEAIKSKYGIEKHELRIYLHYQPTFYHLHVHFCVLKHEAPGILVGKAHLLSDVISNIELAPDYYQKSTISFVIAENHKLFEKLKTAGILQE
nr:unnamed protein product [Callosobruchus analis]